MKELFVWLGLVSCPAIVFAVYGPAGMRVFERQGAASSVAETMRAGQLAFQRECAGCHRPSAGRTARGPNLVDPAYGPSEMADDLIRGAIQAGVPQRALGDPGMPGLDHISERELDSILYYLRAVQRVDGVH